MKLDLTRGYAYIEEPYVHAHGRYNHDAWQYCSPIDARARCVDLTYDVTYYGIRSHADMFSSARVTR